VSRINLPPGCAGFADGDKKYYADKPGGHVELDDVKDANALRKLKNQDYASAGLVDAGPEKQFIRDPRKNGRWCPDCHFLGHSWMKTCSRCVRNGREVATVPESEMPMDLPEGPYMI
jgi:hypothetical protein